MIGTLCILAMLSGTPEAEVPMDFDRDVVAVETAEVTRTLTEAFAAALAGDFKRYLALVHASEKATPQQVTNLERFTFGRFARQVVWYLKGEQAESFAIERVEDLGGGKAKVFVKVLAHPSRPAMPMTLQQDEAGTFILANSL